MTLWLLVPLFALAQASCYDYEYYDPETGSSLPGNACARQQAAAAGQPVAQIGTTQTFGTPAVATTSFGTTFAAPATTTFGTTFAAPATTFGTTVVAPAATFGTQVYGTPVATAGVPLATTYGATSFSAPIVASTSFATPYATTAAVATPVYGTATVVAPRAAVTTVSAPVAVQQSRGGNQGGNQQLSPELEYYRRLGEEQQRQHKQNKRIVDRASRELSRGSLVNTIVAGSGNAAPWFPAYRLSRQRDAAGAYKSEARIANKNADDAYRRYQQDPSRLNLLVSKYQDLNADLRDSAYHYNVINSGTFGQIISSSSGLFSLGGGNGLLSGLTQIISQRQISEDLNGIQRQMQRVARQIQEEAKIAAGGGAQVQTAQGSVQQRMMAMTVYGRPQAQNVRG